MFDDRDRSLEGKKGLVIGIANRESIAYGCAKAFKHYGADLAITYLNDKARPHVESVATELEAPLFLPCDVQQPGQLEAVFEAMEAEWGRLDFALHSIAYAPKADLHGRLVDSTSEGFLTAMDLAARCVATGFGPVAVVAAELWSQHIDPSEPRTYAVFGDAAGAVIFGAEFDRPNHLAFAPVSSIGYAVDAAFEPHASLPIASSAL